MTRKEVDRIYKINRISFPKEERKKSDILGCNVRNTHAFLSPPGREEHVSASEGNSSLSALCSLL